MDQAPGWSNRLSGQEEGSAFRDSFVPLYIFVFHSESGRGVGRLSRIGPRSLSARPNAYSRPTVLDLSSTLTETAWKIEGCPGQT